MAMPNPLKSQEFVRYGGSEQDVGEDKETAIRMDRRLPKGSNFSPKRYDRCFLKNAMVRSHAIFACSLLWRGVEVLWKP